MSKGQILDVLVEYDRDIPSSLAGAFEDFCRGRGKDPAEPISRKEFLGLKKEFLSQNEEKF